MPGLTHLFICRELPPAAYPPGGIGTYVRHMTDLLARAGETVHVIAHRWDGAPAARKESLGGRLIVHRVALDDPNRDEADLARTDSGALVPKGLLASSFPAQAFSWQAALLAEHLVETEGIDIIEAQEWEAPLYYFQLRRALNLGPARRPPCIVHIHSPSAQIFAANGWDTSVADYLPAVAQEEYSITVADAVLCPCRFVADQVLARYKVPPANLTVIPYPRGNSPKIDRNPDAWSKGSICHVGRLEPRKGVLEWADAIASVAADYPDVAFDFVGGDTPLLVTGGPTVGRTMRDRVPRRIRRQLRFHGTRDHQGVMDVLAGACAAVVPSRWENFPYSCIESMSSGLPVIASPNGGMRELVDDGVSGWIASNATPAGLASALRRALETPGQKRQQMGDAAADRVRHVCDNETIVRRHLDLKNQLVGQRLSRAQPGAPRIADAERGVKPPTGSVDAHGGMGLIVICHSPNPQAHLALAAIHAQTERAMATCVVCDVPPSNAGAMALGEGWSIVPRGPRSIDDAAIDAARMLVSRAPRLLGVALIDERVVLDPTFLATCHTVFGRDDRCGMLSGWTHETAPGDRIRVQPCSAVPHVWHDREMTPYVAVSTAALEKALHECERQSHMPSRREIFDLVLRSGWTAVTYPAVLGSIDLAADAATAQPGAARYSLMALAVQRLHTPLLQWLRTCSPADRRAFVREGLRNPGRSARWLAGRATRGWRTSVRSGEDSGRPHDRPRSSDGTP